MKKALKQTYLLFSALSLTLIFPGCDSRKSINKALTTGKDITTGVIVKPEGLSCDDVWLSVNEERTDRITFIYGETFYLNFNNVEGFNKVDGTVFPGMLLKVTDEKGDTIIQTDDIYADSVNGINLSPLLIKTNFNVVKPVYSNHKYTLFIKIWDKLGEGTFITETPFNVIENERISIDKNYISYTEIYLYSVDRNKVITDGIIAFNETVHLVFEGLSGFYENNGKVFPGAKVQANDNSDNPIMYFDDLFDAYTTTGISSDDFKARIYVKMKFTEGKVDNPIHCEATIFDKKRNAANIKVLTDLIIKQQI
jgi:hypothetical protein